MFSYRSCVRLLYDIHPNINFVCLQCSPLQNLRESCTHQLIKLHNTHVGELFYCPNCANDRRESQRD